jgi:hypothetical protein
MQLLLLSLLTLQGIAYKFQYNRVVPRVSSQLKDAPKGESNDMLGEELQEIVDGFETFQKNAFSSLYGKEVRLIILHINPL